MNALNKEIEGKYCVVKKEILRPAYQSITKRIFLPDGGFGCNSYTIGGKTFGTWVYDGTRDMVYGTHYERFATKQEIKDAKAYQKQHKKKENKAVVE